MIGPYKTFTYISFVFGAIMNNGCKYKVPMIDDKGIISLNWESREISTDTIDRDVIKECQKDNYNHDGTNIELWRAFCNSSYVFIVFDIKESIDEYIVYVIDLINKNIICKFKVCSA